MKSMMSVCAAALAASAATCFALERGELLPQESLATIRLSSVPGVLKAADQSPLGRLWRDPQVQAFLGQPPTGEALLRDLLTDDDPDVSDGKKEISRLEFAMLKMLTGELVFGFQPGDEDDAEPAIVAAMTAADYQRSTGMDRRISEIDPKRMSIAKSVFMGRDFYTLTETKEEEEEEETGDGNQKPEPTVTRTYQCHVGQTLVSGPDETWVKTTVARLLKETPAEPTGDPQLTLRLDIPRLLKQAAKEEAKQAERMAATLAQKDPAMAAQMAARPRVTQMLQAMGLNGLGALDLRVLFMASSCQVDMVMPIAEPRTGVLAMLDPTPSPTSLRVPFVSEQTVSYSVSRLDLAALWRTIPSIVAQVAPGPMERAMVQGMMDGFIAGLGIQPDTDLFAHLGTQVVTVSSLVKDDVVQVLAFSLRDEAAIRATLGKALGGESPLAGRLGKRLTVERIGDHAVYMIEAAAPGAAMRQNETEELQVRPGMTSASGTDSEKKRTALAAAGGYLLAGDEVAVRHALQSLASPDRAKAFYDGPLFKRLQQSVPAAAFSYEVCDVARLVRMGLSALTEDEGVVAGMVAGLASSLKLGGEPDPAKLPSASHIAGFFGPMVSAGQLRDGRLRVRVQGLYPEAR